MVLDRRALNHIAVLFDPPEFDLSAPDQMATLLIPVVLDERAACPNERFPLVPISPTMTLFRLSMRS